MSTTESALYLAAEDCPRESFEHHHVFDTHDDRILRSLTSHGPVLIRGARGAGKSALMIEAQRRVALENQRIGVYVSMRYLPLIETSGEEYLQNLIFLVAEKFSAEIKKINPDLYIAHESIEAFQKSITNTCIQLNRSVIIYFDDAAHIGREASLEDFFDFFRTLSSDVISCKASIYPGITRFGKRFDVFNDAFVIDVSRDERLPGYDRFFYEVAQKRRSDLVGSLKKIRGLEPEKIAGILGRTVLGNMRGFVVALSKLNDQPETYGDANDISLLLLELGSSHFWPLLDEVRPKLGRYEPMLDVAHEIAEIIFSQCGDKKVSSAVILREICQKYAKPLEILEYVGFIAKREASRKVHEGRGSRYAANWAVLVENLYQTRLTKDLIDSFSSPSPDTVIFSSGSKIAKLELPNLPEDGALSILDLDINKLEKSNIYPYGLTQDKLTKLKNAGFNDVRQLLTASKSDLDAIPGIGDSWVKRINDVVLQAVWM